MAAGHDQPHHTLVKYLLDAATALVAGTTLSINFTLNFFNFAANKAFGGIERFLELP